MTQCIDPSCPLCKVNNRAPLEQVRPKPEVSSVCVDSVVSLRYLAWLSSRGERRERNNGAVYAGTVEALPEKLKYLLDPQETRRYCVVQAN